MGDPAGIAFGILGLLPLCKDGFIIIHNTIKAESILSEQLARIELHQGDFYSWQETWDAKDRRDAFTNYEERHPVAAREVLRQLGLLSRLFYDLKELKKYGFKIPKSNKTAPQDVSEYRFESGSDMQTTSWDDFRVKCRSNLSTWQKIKFTMKGAEMDLESLIGRMREYIEVLRHHSPGVGVLWMDDAIYRRINDVFRENLQVYIDAASKEASKSCDPSSQMRFRTLAEMMKFQCRVKNLQQTTAQAVTFKYSQFHHRSSGAFGCKGLSELAVLKHFPVKNQHRIVLIEWMENPYLPDRRQHTEKLALLLATTKPCGMLVPRCLGLVEKNKGTESHGIGIVLEPRAHIGERFPQEEKLPKGIITRRRRIPVSLRELLRNSREYCKTDLLALDTRFNIAKKLVTAVYMIHAVKWVHKNIRPESILFFLTEESIITEPEKRRGAHLAFDFNNPMIVGFNHARADAHTQDPRSSSKSASYSDDSDESSAPDGHEGFSKDRLVQEMAKNVTFDYYQHPAKGTDPSLTYVPIYDLYSLGCVLLEIGLWEPIFSDQTLQTGTDATSFETIKRIKTRAADKKLDGMTGSIYAAAVRKCLDLGEEKSLKDPSHFGVELSLQLSKCSS